MSIWAHSFMSFLAWLASLAMIQSTAIKNLVSALLSVRRVYLNLQSRFLSSKVNYLVMGDRMIWFNLSRCCASGFRSRSMVSLSFMLLANFWALFSEGLSLPIYGSSIKGWALFVIEDLFNPRPCYTMAFMLLMWAGCWYSTTWGKLGSSTVMRSFLWPPCSIGSSW